MRRIYYNMGLREAQFHAAYGYTSIADEDGMAEWLDSVYGTLTVAAEDDDGRVAAILVVTRPMPTFIGYAPIIRSLEVAPKHYGQGAWIVKQMLEFISETTRHEYLLAAEESNSQANALMRAFGQPLIASNYVPVNFEVEGANPSRPQAHKIGLRPVTVKARRK